MHTLAAHTVKQPRRRTSFRAVGVAFTLAPALLFVQAPPAQALVLPPLPVRLPPVVVGAPVAGAAVASGELVAGAGILGFGIGYYGAAGAVGLYHVLFGGSGDDRSVRVSGVNGYCWCETDGVTQTTPSPPDSRASLGAFHARSSLNRVTVDSYLYCRNTTTNVVTDHGTAGMARSWDWGPGSPNGNIVTITANCGTGAVISFVRVIAAGGNPTTAARLLDWTYDPPAPWSVNIKTTCRGSNGTVLTTTSSAYTITAAQAVAGGALDLQAPACDPILPNPVVESVAVAGGRSGETGDIQTVPAWTPASITAYPSCTTGQPVGGCELQPRLNGVNCLSGTVDCGDWISRPGHACYWGPYVVADSWCTAAYSAFLSQSTTPVSTPSATPSPSASAVPGTVGTGISTVNNPDGSTTQTQVTTLPNGNTQTVVTVTLADGSKTTTTTITTPAGATVGTPTVATSPGTRPADEATGQEDNCSFGLKPWLWPYRALKCAFIPSSGYVTDRMEAMKNDWNDSPPGKIMTGVVSTFGALGTVFTVTPGGCEGPGLGPIPEVGMAVVTHPLSNCDGAMHQVALLVVPVETGVLYLGAMFVSASLLLSAFNMHWPWHKPDLIGKQLELF